MLYLFISLCLFLYSSLAISADKPELFSKEIHEFLDKHWSETIPLQGKPPADYHDLEISLDPASCGQCHQQQYKDWQSTFHAHAMGPGILGQIIDMLKDGDNNQAQVCWSCHTPLAEQQNVLKLEDGWETNPYFDQDLQHAGLTCAGCHVRQHQRFGPVKKDKPDVVGLIDNGMQPHNGFVASHAFSDSAFCAHCHQFRDDGFALNGKLIENTYKEWQESRYAKEGIHCQNCHMPDRSHTWRGIHDMEMTKSAVTIEVDAPSNEYLLGERYEASIKITNTGAGHYFPTYVTPKVFVRAELLDEAGNTINDSLQEAIIGRETTPNLSQELYDTRIAPGDNVKVIYREALRGKPAELQISVVVEPDHFYERFYKLRLANMEEGQSMDLLRQALSNSQQSHFTIFQKRFPISIDYEKSKVDPSAHKASAPADNPVQTEAHAPYWNDDDITWHSYTEGLKLAKELNKPVLLFFYADWCPTCHAYKPIFEAARIIELSKQFVMVRINSDEFPKLNQAFIPEEEWEYVPRTFALFPDGRRMDNIYAKDQAPRYFLSAENSNEFLYTMRAAILTFENQ